MFWIFTKKDKRTKLEMEIDSVLEVMKNYKPDSKEYAAMVESVERLNKCKSVKPERNYLLETCITVGGTLLGIIWITHHEKTEIITTKAMSLLGKGRV